MIFVVFTELLTNFKALTNAEKEKPLSGRRADSSSVGVVILHNIINRFEIKVLSKEMQYE